MLRGELPSVKQMLPHRKLPFFSSLKKYLSTAAEWNISGIERTDSSHLRR